MCLLLRCFQNLPRLWYTGTELLAANCSKGTGSKGIELVSRLLILQTPGPLAWQESMDESYGEGRKVWTKMTGWIGRGSSVGRSAS